MRVLTQTVDSTSMNASFNGDTMQIGHLEGYSLSLRAVETSATLAGTLKLQGSNNAIREDSPNNDADSNAVWVDITGSTQNVSGTGNFLWNVSEAYYRFVRVVWTRTSGQGTATMYWAGKGAQS